MNMILQYIAVTITVIGRLVAGTQDGIELKCHSDSMEVRLDAAHLLTDTTSPFSAHFIQHSCYKENNGANIITIATPYEACGTHKQITPATIVYSNRVYIQSTSGEDLDVLVHCDISRRDLPVGVMSLSSLNDISTLSSNDTVNETLDDPQVGYGAFYVSIDRYTDSAFTEKYADSGTKLGLNEELFFEVELRNVAGLRLNLESCWATVHPPADSEPNYEFISKGCKVDETVMFYNTNTPPSVQRYSFRSFAFKGNSAEVYLHCKVFICDENSSDCIPSCNRTRRRRNTQRDVIIRDIRSYTSTFNHY